MAAMHNTYWRRRRGDSVRPVLARFKGTAQVSQMGMVRRFQGLLILGNNAPIGILVARSYPGMCRRYKTVPTSHRLRIAAVTGWSIDYCQSVVDVYLPRRTEVALTAIGLWKKAPRVDSNVVNLGLAKRR
jgi:hypothetical protein